MTEWPSKKELGDAHSRSSKHREALTASQLGGCFYCCKTFKPNQVEFWTDDETTALCPECGIDAVLPDSTGRIDSRFLRCMRAYWFRTQGEGVWPESLDESKLRHLLAATGWKGEATHFRAFHPQPWPRGACG